MHPRASRAVSVALSLALHAILLLIMLRVEVVQPGLPEERLLPVRILEPPPPRPAPKQARPAPPAPPPAPKAPEPPPAPAVEAPPPPPPEQKIPLPEQQVVSPPDAGKNEAPPDTRLLSDRDTKVEEQMVKKGQPKPGDESLPESAAEKAAQAPKPAKPERGPGGDRRREPPPQVASLPGLDRLMPNALRLAEEGYGRPAEVAEAAPAERQARRQPASAGGLMIPANGPIGSMDYLPDVREGDITLLNTKAEMFAPFVRRVAVRVFQNFLISFKRDLSSMTFPSTETIEAEAVMDARGEMLRFTIKQRSARIALASDRRLQQACNVGFFDRNPPPGARAADGNIHFILQTAMQVAPSPRGLMWELFLAAGLQ